MSAEPLEEQLLQACTDRLANIALIVPGLWYVPKFVTRTFRLLDSVNELPGYIVSLEPDESGAERQSIENPDATILASMGVEVLAYGAGSDLVPTDRVLVRLLGDAERALCSTGWLGDGPAITIENTRRVRTHETEVGAPWRSMRSHVYRIRYLYTRGEP